MKKKSGTKIVEKEESEEDLSENEDVAG